MDVHFGSWAFILAIEVLFAIRSYEKIEPYFQVDVNEKLSQKVDAYADDVNLTLPRNEESIREVFSLLDKFEQLSG